MTTQKKPHINLRIVSEKLYLYSSLVTKAPRNWWSVSIFMDIVKRASHQLGNSCQNYRMHVVIFQIMALIAATSVTITLTYTLTVDSKEYPKHDRFIGGHHFAMLSTLFLSQISPIFISALHCAPRFLLAFMYKQKLSELSISGKLPKIDLSCWLNVIENMALLVLRYDH